MSESERRIQRIAVGFAVGAMLVAVVAVIVVATRRTEPAHGERRATLASRRVAASALGKLTPEIVEHAGAGLRVTDDAVGKSLGLARDDTIVAISGRPVARPSELGAALHDLEAFRPTSLFVDLVRDREPVLERWELDDDLEAARHAEADPTHPADPLIATIKRINGTTYELPHSTIEAWTADPSKFTTGITSARHLSNPDGFQIETVQPGSSVAALGIQDGDVIRGLNGVEITSIDKVLPIIAKTTTRISVDLQRRGRTIILNYLIK